MNHLQHIRRLYHLPTTPEGYGEDELTAAEQRLNIRFPAVLRQYYQQLGRNFSVNRSFNRLLKPGTEVDFSPDDYLVLCEENQGVVCWGIRRADLALPDPPVYENYTPGTFTDAWLLTSATTGEFLLYMACWNGVLGGLPYNANTTLPPESAPAVLAALVAGWPELPPMSEHQLRLFGHDYAEVLALLTDPQGQPHDLFVGTHDAARFQTIMDRLDLPWHYRSDEDE